MVIDSHYSFWALIRVRVDNYEGLVFQIAVSGQIQGSVYQMTDSL